VLENTLKAISTQCFLSVVVMTSPTGLSPIHTYLQFTARCESLPLARHSIATGKLIIGTEPVYPGAALYEILLEGIEQMAMVNLYGNRQGKQYGKREGQRHGKG